MAGSASPVMSSTVSRAALLCGVVFVACGFAWLTWPRPTLAIEVEPGGHANVVTRFHQRLPLSDTVHLASHGSARIEIDNRDTVAHRLGMFGVGRGESKTFTISHPGVYSGFCSAHPGKHLTYILDP